MAVYTPEEEARDRIQQEWAPQIAGLMREKDAVATEHGALTTATQNYGVTFDNKLVEIYNQLQAQLKERLASTGASYSQAEGQIGQAYQGAGSAIQAAGAEVQGESRGVANRLGLGAAQDATGGRFQQFLSLLNAQNEAGKGQSLANLGAHRAASQAHGEGGIADAAREGAGARQELSKQVVGQLGQLNLVKLKNDTEIQGRLTDLERDKEAALRTMIEDIKNARAEAEREAIKEEFARRIQENTLNIQLAKLGLAQEKQAFDQQIDLARLGQADARLALTERGQNLTHSRATAPKMSSGNARLTGGMVAKPSTIGINTGVSRAAQDYILSTAKRAASRNTYDTVKDLISRHPSYDSAYREIESQLKANPRILSDLGISKDSLVSWVKRYYHPSINDLIAANGR